MTSPPISPAERADLPDIERLLRESALPIAGIGDHLQHFFVFRREGILLGVAGLEHYGSQGLLRSLAVHRCERSKGIGSALTDRVIAEARRLGVERLVLLTTTAERFFARKGFCRIDRRAVTGRMAASAEFTGACPASAVCMELLSHIEGGTP